MKVVSLVMRFFPFLGCKWNDKFKKYFSYYCSFQIYSIKVVDLFAKFLPYALVIDAFPVIKEITPVITRKFFLEPKVKTGKRWIGLLWYAIFSIYQFHAGCNINQYLKCFSLISFFPKFWILSNQNLLNIFKILLSYCLILFVTIYYTYLLILNLN